VLVILLILRALKIRIELRREKVERYEYPELKPSELKLRLGERRVIVYDRWVRVRDGVKREPYLAVILECKKDGITITVKKLEEGSANT